MNLPHITIQVNQLAVSKADYWLEKPRENGYVYLRRVVYVYGTNPTGEITKMIENAVASTLMRLPVSELSALRKVTFTLCTWLYS